MVRLRGVLPGGLPRERSGNGAAVDDDLARLIMVDVNWYKLEARAGGMHPTP
jgi:hypothetical protein